MRSEIRLALKTDISEEAPRHLFSGAFFPLSQFNPADLAADCFGQINDELDLTGELVRSGKLLHEVLNFGYELVRRLVTLLEDHKSFNDFSSDGFGFCHHRRF